jgi:Tol biopolymer transport system component
MGEVYRAEDSRLGRTVAVKVLPPEFADDEDRLRRFEQEARAAGQLSHPNILAIYDIGTDAGVPYIVTELLEGQNLREVVGHGPLPPRRAIEIAIQVARGLTAAQAKGITHRDLKPENVFIARDGRVKILDFGLAKLTRPSGGPVHDKTASIQAGLTMTGTILGTASYMAPEQIREQAVDHRADIFALGCILSEMLSGRRAFDGETPMDRMTAILHSDPPALPRAVEEAAPGIGTVVRRALEKKVEDRFESARELAFALGLVTERAGAAREIAAAAASAAAEVPASHTASLLRLTYREGTVYAARFAPDGQAVYYSAAWEGRPPELFWAHSGNPESRALGYANAEILAVAPSGEMAVSLRRENRGGFIRSGMLARMPLGGGAPRELLDDVHEADWSPDGRQLAIIRQVGGLTRLEFPIGKVLYQSAGWQSHLRVSPDGKRIAFIDHPYRGNDGGSVAVVDLDGNFRILSGGWSSLRGIAWRAEGREVWFTAFRSEASRTLYGVTLDGAQRPIFQTAGPMILQDISRQGQVLVAHGNERMRMQIRGAGEERARDLSWLDWTLVRDVSPDGKTILFDETGIAGGEFHAVYMRDADGSPAVKLGEGVAPRLSPDGRWALTLQEGAPARVLLLPTGAGETQIVPTGRLNCHNVAWFPDGKHICVVANEGTGGLRLYELNIENGEARAISEEGVSPLDVLVAPDGGSIGARSPDLSVKLYPVTGGDPRPMTECGPQDRLVGWNADGSALFVIQRGVLPAKLFRIDPASGERKLFREIAPSDPTGVDGLTQVRMTPDESTFVYSYPQSLYDLYVIEGLR